MRFVSDPISLDKIREFFVPGKMIKTQYQIQITCSITTESGDHFLVLTRPEPSGDQLNQLVVFKVLLEKKGVLNFEFSRYWNYPILLDIVPEKEI